ncbi:MAG: hypothetical protein KGL56_04385 [Alphaproteobacteria bacterium]|nr:hypothetical protein [Alphaproteobacteria bacterium]MDE2499410.1 hypothetical protein [Alphaproteobacteria bacterium]
MCRLELDHVDSIARISRRRLVAGIAGLSLLALRAKAAGHVGALALTCIDYRLVDDAVHFFDGMHLTNEYDQLSLAGASLAAVSEKFPSSNKAFWDHVQIAKDLHHVKKLIVLDHRDCGAYKVAFGKAFAAQPDAETMQHKSVMLKLHAQMAKRHPDLAAEFYLMALDGSAQRVL